ncbi:MAG: molybdopterin converting factor subunit 1 [bacterium]
MKLLYFAWVRQKIGVSEEDFASPASVRDVTTLIEALRKRGTGYAEAFSDVSLLRCAVNQQYVDLNAHVGTDDEVAFFPPVTGG